MLVVGEASGDIHGAHLVKALSDKDQTLRFFGVAGEQLKQTKFEALLDVSQLAGMGFVELAGQSAQHLAGLSYFTPGHARSEDPTCSC